MHSGTCIQLRFSKQTLLAEIFIQNEFKNIESIENLLPSKQTNSFIQSSSNNFQLSEAYLPDISNLVAKNEFMDTPRQNWMTNSSGKSKGGKITCCVPECYSNSKRNPELSYYVIPKEENLRKKWLHMISRKSFVPSTSHRVCSKHFEGGKKT